MADEGLRFEAFTMPHVGSLTRKFDFTKWVNDYTLNDRFNDLSDGIVTIPDDFPLAGQLFHVDESTHANDVGSMIRILRGTTPVMHYLITRSEDTWSDDDPTHKLTLEGLEWLLDRALIPNYDHPVDPSVESDWIYGAPSILANFNLEISGITTAQFQLSIAATAGTFTINFSAHGTSPPINFNAGASDVQTAVEAITGINDVTVSGDGTATNPFVVEVLDPTQTDIGTVSTNSAGLTGLASVQIDHVGGQSITAPWTRSQNPTNGLYHGTYFNFETSTVQAHSGTVSLYVKGDLGNSSGSFPGAQQLVAAAGGRTYRASVWVYPKFAARYRFVIRTSDETLIPGAIVEADLTANSWQQLVIPGTVLIPPHIRSVIFRVACISNIHGQHEFFVDDALLAPGMDAATLGKMVDDVRTAALTVGSPLAWLTPTWTTTLDSDGVAWDQARQWNVNHGQTFLQLLEYCKKWNYESRIRWDEADARFEWDMWNPGGGGQQRPGIAITGKSGVTGAAPIVQRPPGATYLKTEGEQGHWGEYASTTLDDVWGRLERFHQDRQGVDSTELDELAERMVTRHEANTYTRSITVSDPVLLPWTAYEPGDTVTLNLAPKDVKRGLRVASIVVSMSALDSAPRYDVHFGSPVLTDDASIAQGLKTLIREFRRPAANTAPVLDGRTVAPPQPVTAGGAPTVVVAAYNASALSKSKADFVATSSDATAVINQGLGELMIEIGDDTSELGGRLLLTEGDFALSNTITINFGVRIEGMGKSSTRLRMANNANVGMFQSTLATGHIEFASFDMNGAKATQSGGTGRGFYLAPNGGGDLSITDVSIRDFRGVGIFSDRSARAIHLTRCLISGNMGDGFYSQREGAFKLTNCRFNSNGGWGINCEGAYLILMGSEISGNTSGGLLCAGTLAFPGQVITGNQFNSNVGPAISINSWHFVISDNYMTSNLNGILATANGKHALVANNVIDTTGESAIVLANGVLSSRGGLCQGNQIWAAGQHGIYLIAGGVETPGWLVTGNHVDTSSQDGANLYDGIHVASSNNAILANMIRQNAGGHAQRYAVNVTGGCNRVAGNDLGDPDVYGSDAYNDAGTNNQKDWPSSATYGDNFTECEETQPEQVDIVPPDPPQNLTANGGLGEVVLNWDDNTEPDLELYSIYQASAADGPWSLVGTSATSAFTVTGLLSNTAYWFRVTAEDNSGNESEPSDTATDTTDTPAVDTTPPAAPTGLSAIGAIKQVSLNWDDNVEGDLASYRVKRALVTTGPYTTIATVTASQYINTGLADATTYFYVVSAVDDSGNASTNSAEASAKTADAADVTAPAVPTGLGATGGLGQIVLNWNDNAESDFGFYRVYRSFTSGGTYTQIATTTVSGYTVTGLAAGTQYWFKVAAEDTTGNLSAQTASVNATTDAPVVDTTPPAVPTGLTANGGAGQATINWADNTEPDLASYRVKRSTVSGGPYTVVANVTLSNYVDLGLAASTTYYYVVSALDDSGNESADTAQDPATTNATVPPPSTFPPPTPPQVVVNEAYPATPDITLAVGASINGALSIGHRIIKLTPGFYGSQQIAPRTGSYIYCQTGVATFDGGQVLNRLFITGGTAANNVTLRGLEIKRFYAEPPGANGRGIIVTPSGSSNWKFIQCHIWHGNNAAFRLTGTGHQVINCQIHDFAKYAFNDGSGHTIKGCEIYRIAINDGSQLVPPSTDSNRGVSKFAAGGTGGYTFEDCYLHDVNGQGFWLDGARGGAVCRRIKSVNVERSTFFAEVCWGPNTVSDIDVVGGAKGIGAAGGSSLIDYPSHGAVGVSLSPNTTFSRIRARNVGIGIQILNSSSHPTLTEGTSVHTAAEVRPHLGIGQLDIRDIDISATRFAIGFTGSAFSDFPDTQEPDITISGVQLYSKTGNPQYGAAYDPAFRWQADFPMTLAEWNAFDHPQLTK